MLTSPWDDTEFVKAKAEDLLLSKLTDETASFLAHSGLPRNPNGFFFDFDSGLRHLQDALLASVGPEYIRRHVNSMYAKHPAPDNLLAIGWYGGIAEVGFSGCVCINPDRHNEIVWFDHLSENRDQILISSNVERFFATLILLNAMYVEMPFYSGTDPELYYRHYREMTQSMREAMIAEEVSAFDFDGSLWAEILKAIIQEQY